MKDPNVPYVIETDPQGINLDIADELVRAARELPVYDSDFNRPVRVEDESDDGFHIEHRTTPCVRCHHDDVLIWPDDLPTRVGHLTREHGYRMDGRRVGSDTVLDMRGA